MLNELVIKAERRQSGHTDPFDEHHKRPLKQHLRDFRAHLEAKGNGQAYIGNTISCVKAILDGCGFKRISDIRPLLPEHIKRAILALNDSAELETR